MVSLVPSDFDPRTDLHFSGHQLRLVKGESITSEGLVTISHSGAVVVEMAVRGLLTAKIMHFSTGNDLLSNPAPEPYLCVFHVDQDGLNGKSGATSCPLQFLDSAKMAEIANRGTMFPKAAQVSIAANVLCTTKSLLNGETRTSHVEFPLTESDLGDCSRRVIACHSSGFLLVAADAKASLERLHGRSSDLPAIYFHSLLTGLPATFVPTNNILYLDNPLCAKAVYTTCDPESQSQALIYDITPLVEEQLWSGERIIIVRDNTFQTSTVIKVGIVRSIEDSSFSICTAEKAVAIEWLASESLPDFDDVDDIQATLISNRALGQALLFVYSAASHQCQSIALTITPLPVMKAALRTTCTLTHISGLPVVVPHNLPISGHHPVPPVLSFITTDGELQLYRSEVFSTSLPMTPIATHSLGASICHSQVSVATHAVGGSRLFIAANTHQNQQRQMLQLCIEPIINDACELTRLAMSSLSSVLSIDVWRDALLALRFSSNAPLGWQDVSQLLSAWAGVASVANDPTTESMDELLDALLEGDSPSLMNISALGTLAACRSGTLPVRHLSPPTPQQLSLAVLALHMLLDSLSIQEDTWSYSTRIATLLLPIVRDVLGWHRYAAMYEKLLGHTQTSVATDSQSITITLPREEVIATFGVGIEPYLADGRPPSSYERIRQIMTDLKLGANLCNKSWPFASRSNMMALLTASSASVEQPSPELVASALHYITSGEGNTDSVSHWWVPVVRRYSSVLSKAPRVAGACRACCIGVTLPLLQALARGHANAKEFFGNDLEVLAAVGRRDILMAATLTPRWGHGHLTRKVLEGSNDACDGSQQQTGRPSGYTATQQLRADGSLLWFAHGETDSVLIDTLAANAWDDARLDVVQTLLNTAVPIALSKRSLGGGGDSADVQRAELAVLIKRAVVVPTARGMLTLGTENFRLRDTIPIPPLILDGQTSDGLQIRVDALPDLSWAHFHNGCAAGLRFLTPFSKVSRSWVNYQTREDDSHATAGIILSLGLLGHLKCLEPTDIFTFLQKRKDHSAIALMLGLAATYRGTDSEAVIPCLSMHVESLNHTADDMEVPATVQTTALIAIGFVRQGTCHTFLVEMLMGEISRAPTDQHAAHRSSYALGAGIALGLVSLGKGLVQRPNIAKRLLAFMNGERRERMHQRIEGYSSFRDNCQPSDPTFKFSEVLHSLPEQQQGSSCQTILEGGCYNKAVTGPASVMALTLMYLKSNDVGIATSVAPPNNLHELRGLTPDSSLLRVLSASLIRWNSIGYTRAWIYESGFAVPSVATLLFGIDGASTSKKVTRMDHLSPVQQFLLLNVAHMVSGACLAIGFCFAGTQSLEARNTIMAELRGFAEGKLGSTGIVLSPLQLSSGAFESCISNCSVALGLCMAGKGDVISFALLRMLSDRPAVPPGGHQPIAMAIGLLFLAGGTCTIDTSEESLAALLISLYPVWSAASPHATLLQPLRHFYATAATPSVLEVIDSESGETVSATAKMFVSKRNCVPQSIQWATTKPSFAIFNHELDKPGPRPDEAYDVLTLTSPCLIPANVSIRKIELATLAHYPLVVAGRGNGNGSIAISLVKKTSDGRMDKENVPAAFANISVKAPVVTSAIENLLATYLRQIPARGHVAMKGCSVLPTLNVANVLSISLVHSFVDRDHQSVISSSCIASLCKVVSTSSTPLLSRNAQGSSILREIVKKGLSCSEASEAYFGTPAEAQWIQHSLIAIGIVDIEELGNILEDLEAAPTEKGGSSAMRQALQLASVTNLPFEVAAALI